MKLRLERKVVEIVRELEGGTLKFQVAILNQKEITKLLDMSIDHEWERGQRFDKVNHYSFLINKIDKMIIGWEGPEDKDGQPLDCTRENKELVNLYYSDLISSVLEEAESIAKNFEKAAKESEKN
jgi:hypothetical protein